MGWATGFELGAALETMVPALWLGFGYAGQTDRFFRERIVGPTDEKVLHRPVELAALT